MQTQRIQSIKKIGIQDTIDLEIDHLDNNFFAEGIVTSNSHAIGYSLLSYFNAEIKIEETLSFFAPLLNNRKPNEPLEELFDISAELPDFTIQLLPPSIDKVSNKFLIEENNIRYPIGLIKSLGEELYKKLEALTPNQLQSFDSCIETFINSGLNSRSIESIISCGALDKFNIPREDILLYFWFLSDLQPEVLDKFWVFKNGHSFSVELINNFLNYKTEEVINKKGKIKVKSYFKTEATREKNIKSFQEYCELNKQYKTNVKAAYYIWEINALGYSNNYKFSDNIKTFREMDALDLNEKVNSFGLVEEIMHRKSDKGNEYGIYSLKFDKRARFIFFGNSYIAAKNLIQEGDYITFTGEKETKGMKISALKNVNNEIRKYEFYKKNATKDTI